MVGEEDWEDVRELVGSRELDEDVKVVGEG